MNANKKPLFAFFGTPLESVYVLEALRAEEILPALVVTAPDKPRGRGLTLSPSPVKTWAQKHSIEIMQPTKLTDESVLNELRNSEWDMFIVAAYAKRISNALLSLPQHGCLNVHPSLLPKFRGPSPVISAILADARTTGVSIMQMNENMDTGAVIAQAKIELDEEEWPPEGSTLSEMLFTEGGVLLAEVLPQLMSGSLTPQPQDEQEATYTKKFSDEDAVIDLHGNARQALLHIRAFNENPRAHFFAMHNGKRLRVIITKAELREGVLEILLVIPEGKKEMTYDTLLRSGIKPA